MHLHHLLNPDITTCAKTLPCNIMQSFSVIANYLLYYFGFIADFFIEPYLVMLRPRSSCAKTAESYDLDSCKNIETPISWLQQ